MADLFNTNAMASMETAIVNEGENAHFDYDQNDGHDDDDDRVRDYDNVRMMYAVPIKMLVHDLHSPPRPYLPPRPRT